LPDLAALIGDMVPPFAMAGLAFQHGDGQPVFHISTSPGLTADPDTLWRAASMSKVVTGAVVAAVADKAGLHPPYTVDIADLLGFPLRNPAGPGQPLTLGEVASHTSGLTDDAGYLLPPDAHLADWLADKGAAIFRDTVPGTSFHYCNLGYVLLAAVAEKLSGQRFDHLAQSLVLRPLGITGGFNWSDVAQRANRIATYRRDGRGLIAQIDAVVAEMGVSGPDGGEIDQTGWVPGRNPGVFSPQGGLRLSLRGALQLARSLVDLNQQPLWQGDLNGLQGGTGMGLIHIYDARVYPRPLIGHFAGAYGMTGGLWWDAAQQRAFAYTLNGLPMGDDSDALRASELAIFAAVASYPG
jgi:CubicO group peptidase (beta-lactamase class C family)